MKRLQLSRRAMLAGGAGAAISLPWLEAMLPIRQARAAVDKPPLRFIAFVTHNNGIFPERFWPRFPGEPLFPLDQPPRENYLGGGGACMPCGRVAFAETRDFVFSPGLEPLSRHRDDLLIIEGLDSSGGPGHDHWPSVLTGRTGRSTGISLDKEIANLIAGPTKFKSLHLGARTKNDIPFSNYGVDQPALAENDPSAVFDRIFSEVAPPDTSALDRLRADRRSMLDAALVEITGLQKQVGQADRVKLQNYFDSIREVELGLDGVAKGLGCRRPQITATPGEQWWGDDANTPAVMNAQLDMLAMSLACDLTRVATISMLNGNMSLPWLGITEELHEGVSHAVDSNMDAQNKIGKVDIWLAQQMSGLIDRLKAIPEGDGTVFDNTLILWVQEIMKGNSHSTDNTPHVLAGSAQGYFKTGRYLRLPRGDDFLRPPFHFGTWSNNLKLTVLQSMGGKATSFGDPAQCTGTLEMLRA